MNLKQITKAYLTFSRRELNGIIILLSILTVIIIINRTLPLFANTPDPSVEFKEEIQAFIQEQKKIKDSIATADSIRKAKYNYYKTAKTQRRKETINQNQSQPNYNKSQSNHYQSPSAQMSIVEVNSADTSELIKIRGIGPVFASRILKYRKLLGGYYKKEQLLEVYGIDTAAFNNIENQIIIDTTLISKININTVEFKQALKHPYLKYEDVKAIFKLRNGGRKITMKKLDKIKLSNNMILRYLDCK